MCVCVCVCVCVCACAHVRAFMRMRVCASACVHVVFALSSTLITPLCICFIHASVIQSIFAFCILVYYGNASSRDIHKVHRFIKQAHNLTHCQCQSKHEIYNIVCTRKVRLIVGDEAHPLHQLYSKLRSGIRFKSMRGRTKRYLTSFVPASITHFNSLCRR